jgi:prophage tail gpP-like protein
VAVTDTGLTVHFELLGRQETRFIEWQIDSSYLTSTDGFSFTISPGAGADRSLLRDLEIQPVELLVNGASQCFGRVDATSIGDRGSALTCEGRDFIADIVECNVDPYLKFSAGTTVGVALVDAMSPCGIKNVYGPEDVSMADVRSGKKTKGKPPRGPKAELAEDAKPRFGEGIYEFCNRIVARYGATIQPGPDRTAVVLDRPNYSQEPRYRLARSDDTTQSKRNNVLSASARRDYSRFPTFVLFTGTAGKSGKSGSGLYTFFDTRLTAAQQSDEMGRILNAGIVGGRLAPGVTVENPAILYRLLSYRDEQAKTQAHLDNAARRAYAERLKDSLSYRVKVQGHADPETGAIWSVNTMAHVDDAICGINEPLWIASRTLRYSQSEGATTELELWRPRSFVIFPENE